MVNDNDASYPLEHSRNKQEQKSAWQQPDLNESELKAIQLRFQGKTSTEIAKPTGFKASYIRKLFMRGGRLENAYQVYAGQQQNLAQERASIALERAKREAEEAIVRMIALSKDPENGPVCFKANEYLLNVAGVTLQGILRKLTYDEAKQRVNQAFLDVFGKPFEQKADFDLSPELIARYLEIKERNILIRNDSAPTSTL